MKRQIERVGAFSAKSTGLKTGHYTKSPAAPNTKLEIRKWAEKRAQPRVAVLRKRRSRRDAGAAKMGAAVLRPY